MRFMTKIHRYYAMVAPIVVLGLSVFVPMTIELSRVHSQEIPVSDDFNTYYNYEYGVGIWYPPEWEKVEVELFKTLQVNNTVQVVSFNPPDKSVSVGIIVEKLTRNYTLKTYVNDFLNSQKKNNLGLEVVNSTSTNVAGMPSQKFDFRGTVDMEKAVEVFGIKNLVGDPFNFPPITTEGMQFVVLKGGNAYSVVYQDTSGVQNAIATMLGTPPSMSTPVKVQNQFSHYLPLVQDMVDSFQIDQLPIRTAERANTSIAEPTGAEADAALCLALKMRLAQGNITIPEYEELKKVIGCV